jgi:hypothetical protein
MENEPLGGGCTTNMAVSTIMRSRQPPPPATTAPDHHIEEYSFDQLGVRVPAILVSPFVKSGVIHTVFDHTSLLRYLIDKWGLGPLGARVANANTFSSFLLTKPEATDDFRSYRPIPLWIRGSENMGKSRGGASRP